MFDAKISSIAITELLYGYCSNEDKIVTNEWVERHVGDEYHADCFRFTTPLNYPYLCDYDVDSGYGQPWHFSVSDGPYNVYFQQWSIPWTWTVNWLSSSEFIVSDFGTIPPGGQTWYLFATSSNSGTQILKWSIVDCDNDDDPCEDFEETFRINYEEIDIALNPVLPVNEAILIYPNPANDEIRFNNYKYESLIIFDIKGKKVLSIFEFKEAVDVSHLTNGLYFVISKIENEIKYERLIISN